PPLALLPQPASTTAASASATQDKLSRVALATKRRRDGLAWRRRGREGRPAVNKVETPSKLTSRLGSGVSSPLARAPSWAEPIRPAAESVVAGDDPVYLDRLAGPRVRVDHDHGG